VRKVELERVHSGENASVYQGQDGRKYLLRPVDRDYKGRSKPPAYYLLVQETGEPKPRYISGLFKTEQPGVLSGDFRDEMGVKRMFTFRVTDQGAGAAILPGRADKESRHSKGVKTGHFEAGNPVQAGNGRA